MRLGLATTLEIIRCLGRTGNSSLSVLFTTADWEMGHVELRQQIGTGSKVALKLPLFCQSVINSLVVVVRVCLFKQTVPDWGTKDDKTMK